MLYQNYILKIYSKKAKSEDHVPRKKPGRVKYDPIPPPEETADHIPRKRLGRVKYGDIPPSPKESPEKSTKSEKRIPSTLRHRNR